MVSETLISAFLEASVTGAGLALAVYTLMISILRQRVYRLEKLIEQLNKEKKKITKDSKRLNQLQKKMKHIRVFPNYLFLGILSAFFFFTNTVFFCGAWFWNMGNRNPDFELLISVNFFVALSSFFLIGIFGMSIILNMMREEFEDIDKKKQ